MGGEGGTGKGGAGRAGWRLKADLGKGTGRLALWLPLSSYSKYSQHYIIEADIILYYYIIEHYIF
jgi:hypothetical protein